MDYRIDCLENGSTLQKDNHDDPFADKYSALYTRNKTLASMIEWCDFVRCEYMAPNLLSGVGSYCHHRIIFGMPRWLKLNAHLLGL